VKIFSEPLIQPCSVPLKKLSSDIFHGDHSAKSTLDLQSSEKSRPVKLLSVSYFACKTAHCALKFSTEVERLKHEMLVHFSTSESAESTKILTKCIYCGMFSNGINHMSEHVRRQHKHAIKRGNSKIEKRKPVNKMSTKLRRNFLPCIYCQKIYRNVNTLGAHIKNAHAAISFKCRFRGCHQYFFSQAEMKAHYCQKHQLEESLKHYHCPNCSYKSNNKSLCLIHFKRSHFAAANAFSTQESLKRHLKIFQEERCTCEHCGKMLLKSSLAAHFLGEKCKGLISK